MENMVSVRRNSAVILEHAIARLGYWDAQGWLTVSEEVSDAISLLQHAKWGLEAMDSPACNRYWTKLRMDYEASTQKQ
jgi:hypothetical protein